MNIYEVIGGVIGLPLGLWAGGKVVDGLHRLDDVMHLAFKARFGSGTDSPSAERAQTARRSEAQD